jgi:PAS domain S-box-containing protein
MALPEKQHSVESLIEDTLFYLGNLEVDSPSRFRDALSLLTEKTASVFCYDRVGVWFFDEDKKSLTAEVIYEHRFKKHSSGAQVGLSEYPLYLDILRSVRAHTIPTINESNVPGEMFHGYFKKHDIQSIISSGIWCKGDLVGVVSSSTVGRNHVWSLQERLYFASLGDLVSRWLLLSLTDHNEIKRQKISIRKLVKELTVLCSRASVIGFREATQTSLTSINQIVHASRTRAVIIEDRQSYTLSSKELNSDPVSRDHARKLFLLAVNSKVIWIPDLSKAPSQTTQIIKKLGVQEHASVLIAPFGTHSEHGFHDTKKNIHGVVCIEFHYPLARWNDGLKEVLLCATDAFSILAEYAQTKALYKESLEIARAAFEHSTVGMILFSSVGKILKINRSFTDMIGGLPERYFKMNIWDVLPSLLDHFLRLESLKKISRAESYQFEEKLHSEEKDTWGLFNISFVPASKNATDHSDGYFLMQALNITQRKEAQLALAEQSTFFRTVIDTDPNFIFAKDRSGLFTLANKAVAEAYGTTTDQIIGKSDADFNPDSRQVQGFRKDDECVLNTGIMLDQIEETVTDSAGRTRYLQTVKCPIFDTSGTPAYVLGVSTDITERKKEEEKKQQLLRKLEHTQKLESLGVLASGIAHDFNNILLGIISNSALSLKYIDKNNPAKEYIEKTVLAAENATELTSQLLSYSGKGTFFKTPLELTSIVRETCMLVERITETKGKVVFSASTEDIIVDADIGQLRQVILNLVTNAADAIEPDAGEIIIRTYTQYITSAPLNAVCDDFRISPGYYGILEVYDNGCGMSEEVKRNIFDPFFTTKFTGRGLGLASVLGIVRSHKGALCLKTAPDCGSSFRVLLPVSEAPADKVITSRCSQDDSARCFISQDKTILLIEDELIPREVCTYMLESSGYKVLYACDGEQGISIFKQQSQNITAIILDLTMPKLDGREVYKQIRSMHKTVPVLLTSGYHESQFCINSSDHDSHSAFIQKPFVPNSLDAALTSLFHGQISP